MSNLKTLKPPNKGEIRNPKGKPVGTKNRSTILKKWIEVNAKVKNPITKQEEGGTVEDLITIALITKALKGDVQAIKEINDTLYGKIQDNHLIEGLPQALQINVTSEKTKDAIQKLSEHDGSI